MRHSYCMFYVLLCAWILGVLSEYKLECSTETEEACTVSGVTLVINTGCLYLVRNKRIIIEQSILTFLDPVCTSIISSGTHPISIRTSIITTPTLSIDCGGFNLEDGSFMFVRGATSQTALCGYDGAGGSNLGLGGKCSVGSRGAVVPDFTSNIAGGGMSFSDNIRVYGGGSLQLKSTGDISICGLISADGDGYMAESEIFQHVTIVDSVLPEVENNQFDTIALYPALIRIMMLYLPDRINLFPTIYRTIQVRTISSSLTANMLAYFDTVLGVHVNSENVASYGLKGVLPDYVYTAPFDPFTTQELVKRKTPRSNSTVRVGGGGGGTMFFINAADHDVQLSLCLSGLRAVGGRGGPGAGGGSGGRVLLKGVHMANPNSEPLVYGGPSDIDGRLPSCEAGASGVYGVFDRMNEIQSLKFMGTSFDQKPSLSLFTDLSVTDIISFKRAAAYVNTIRSGSLVLENANLMNNNAVDSSKLNILSTNVDINEGSTIEAPQIVILCTKFTMQDATSMKATESISLKASLVAIKGSITSSLSSVDPSLSVFASLKVEILLAKIFVYTLLVSAPDVIMSDSEIDAKGRFDGDWCSSSMTYPLCLQYDRSFTNFDMLTPKSTAPLPTVIVMTENFKATRVEVYATAIGICTEHSELQNVELSATGLGCGPNRGHGAPHKATDHLNEHAIQGGSYTTFGGNASDVELLYGSHQGTCVGSGGSSTAAGGLVFFSASSLLKAGDTIIAASGLHSPDKHSGAGSGGAVSLQVRRMDVENLLLEVNGGGYIGDADFQDSNFAGGAGGVIYVEYLFGTPESESHTSSSRLFGGSGSARGESGLFGTMPSCGVGKAEFLCYKCYPGQYSDVSNSHDCQMCPEGTFSGEGAAECTACPKGTFNPTLGAKMCLPCNAGTFSADSGQSSCDVCPQNTYTDKQGAQFCENCGVNYFGNTPSSCAVCPYGTSRDENEPLCTSCSEAAPSGSKFKSVGCDFVCNVGRVGDKCLYPLDTQIHDFGSVLVCGFLLASILVAYIPSIFFLIGSYKRKQQFSNHLDSLNSGDIKRHIARVLFSGHNTPGSPLYLNPSPEVYFQAHVIPSAYTRLAEAVNSRLKWSKNEKIVLAQLWLCPPLRYIFLRKRQSQKVTHASVQISRADSVCSDPQASALGDCVRAGYSGCYSFLWLDQLRPRSEMGLTAHSILPKAIPLPLPQSLSQDIALIAYDPLFSFMAEEIGEGFDPRALKSALYTSKGAARVDRLMRLCNHVNAWSQAQPTRHYVGLKAAYISLHLVKPTQTETLEYGGKFSSAGYTAFEQLLVEKKKTGDDKHIYSDALFLLASMETITASNDESSDDEEEDFAGKSVSDLGLFADMVSSTDDSSSIIQIQAISSEKTNTPSNSLYQDSSMPSEAERSSFNTPLRFTPGTTTERSLKFTPVTERSMMRDISSKEITPIKPFAGNQNNNHHTTTVSSMFLQSDLLGRIELNVDPALSEYAYNLENPMMRSTPTNKLQKTAVSTFEQALETAANDVRAWEPVNDDGAVYTRRLCQLGCSQGTYFAIPASLFAGALVSTAIVCQCVEVYMTMGVLPLILVLCSTPVALPILPFLIAHACLLKDPVSARNALFTAYCGFVQLYAPFLAILLSVLFQKSGIQSFVFPVALLVSLFICTVCLEGLVKRLSITQKSQHLSNYDEDDD